MDRPDCPESVKVGGGHLVQSLQSADRWFFFTPEGREVSIRVDNGRISTRYLLSAEMRSDIRKVVF